MEVERSRLRPQEADMARTRRARGGLVSLALEALLTAMILPVSSPAASAAEEVRCGMTVTEDLTLEADLFCDDQHTAAPTG